MEDLIGKKVRGFKFEGDYVPQMDRHIGEVGEIISVNLKRVRVQFNKTTWRYPADQIEKHLVMKTGKQVEKLYLTDKVMYIGNAFGSVTFGTYYSLINEFDNDYLVLDNYGNELAIPKKDFADKDKQLAKAIANEAKERAKNYMMLKDGYRLKEEALDDVQKDIHYDNSNGSLYLFAQQQGLNAWEFDCIKRLVRCRKKGQFKEDLEKTIRVIELYLKEYES